MNEQLTTVAQRREQQASNNSSALKVVMSVGHILW